MWPFSRRTETREATGGYTSIISALIEAQAAGTTQQASATAATEAVAGALSRAFADATVDGPDDIAEALSPRTLAQIGRDLVRVGESLHVIRMSPGRLRLFPASTWYWEGEADPDDWLCTATVYGPSGSSTLALAAIVRRVCDVGLADRPAVPRTRAGDMGGGHFPTGRQRRAIAGERSRRATRPALAGSAGWRRRKGRGRGPAIGAQGRHQGRERQGAVGRNHGRRMARRQSRGSACRLEATAARADAARCDGQARGVRFRPRAGGGRGVAGAVERRGWDIEARGAAPVAHGRGPAARQDAVGRAYRQIRNSHPVEIRQLSDGHGFRGRKCSRSSQRSMASPRKWRWRWRTLATAMPDDPTLAYRGPESRSIPVLAILFSGAAVDVRGVIGNAETSASEAGLAWSDAGPLAWISYSDDPAGIEFIQYADPAIGRTLHRRVLKAERLGSQYNTVKLNLASRVDRARADFPNSIRPTLIRGTSRHDATRHIEPGRRADRQELR